MSDTAGNMFAELEALAVPVADLKEHPDNYNHGDVPAIAESLKTNRLYKPVIYQRSTGYVLAGNHTLLAARQLGWDTIAAIGIEPDPDTARRILLVDNQSARRSTFDDAALLELLQELPDLLGTGFSDDDLEDLLAAQEHDAIELPPAPTEATYAETPEEAEARAERITQQTPHDAKGLAEIVLVMTIDDKEDFLRDLDAIAKHGGGTTRAAAAARAARIALTVLDSADTNHSSTVDWATLLQIADTSMEDIAA